MWREITEADVQGVLNAPEVTAYQRAAIATGQNVLAQATAAVVEMCRSYIADNPQNTLAAGVTLPERAILSACHIIRVELLTRLNIPVSEDRRKDKTEAIRFFERLADAKGVVERPDGADTDAMPAPSPKIRARLKKFRRDQQNGI